MAKKKNARFSGENANSAGNSTSRKNSEPVDLLELGPDDGQELLEFEGSSHQSASIKVMHRL